MIGIFLDSETNGLNFQRHQVIEIAYKLVNMLNGETIAEYDSLITQPIEEWEKSDPDSLKVNGFTWDEVQKGKDQDVVADEIKQGFQAAGIERGKAVFICQNPSFDRAFFSLLINSDVQEKLNWPYHWLDLASMFWTRAMIDAKSGNSPYPWETGFTKNKIATYYNLGEEDHPHRALNGVNHLIRCYELVVGYPFSTTN